MERYRILIATRAPADFEELRKALVSSGYEARVVADGMTAFNVCREFRPHVAVAEVELPKLDGHHLFQELRAQSATRDIPFILMSRHRSVEERIQSINLGLDDYVSIPFHPDEVVLRIEIILNEIQRLKTAAKSTKGFYGQLSEMNVVEVLQVLEIGKKSAVVDVHSDDEHGRIFVRSGEVVDAVLEELEPERALFRMFSWNEGRFGVQLGPIERPRCVHRPTANLIEQGFLFRDRWDKIARTLPPLQAAVRATPKLQREEYSEAERSMLTATNGQTRFVDLIRRSALDDFQALQVLARLYYQGSLQELPVPEKMNGERPRAPVTSCNGAASRERLTRLVTSFLEANAARAEGARRGLEQGLGEGNSPMTRPLHLQKSELLMIRNKLSNGKRDE